MYILGNYTGTVVRSAGPWHGKHGKQCQVHLHRVALFVKAASTFCSDLSMSTSSIPPTRVVLGTYDGWIYGWEKQAGKVGQQVGPPASTSSLLPGTGSRRDGGGMDLVFAYEAHVGVVRCSSLMKGNGGKILATGGEDESIRIYNLKTRREVGELVLHTGGVSCLEFVGTKHLLSASEDCTLRIWRVSDWACVHVLGGHKAGITSLAVHHSGRLGLTCSKDKTMRLWNLVEGRCAYISRFKNIPEKVTWSPSGERYAVLFRTEIFVYSAQDGSLIGECRSKVRIQDFLFLSEKDILFSGPFGKLLAWNYEQHLKVEAAGQEGQLTTLDAGTTDRIRSINSIDKSNIVLSVTSSGLVHVWDLRKYSATTKPVAELKQVVRTGSRVTCSDACLEVPVETVENVVLDKSAQTGGVKAKRDRAEPCKTARGASKTKQTQSGAAPSNETAHPDEVTSQDRIIRMLRAGKAKENDKKGKKHKGLGEKRGRKEDQSTSEEAQKHKRQRKKTPSGGTHSRGKGPRRR